MASRAGAPLGGPLLAPCRIFVHDPGAAAGASTPERIVPRDWPHHRYAQDVWLSAAARAGRGLLRRAARASEADLIVVQSNFSLLCVAKKSYTARRLWQHFLNDSTLCDARVRGRDLDRGKGDPRCRVPMAAKLLSLTNSECAGPWRGWGGPNAPPSRPTRDYLYVTDRLNKGFANAYRTLVSPALISRPAWLTGAAPLPPSLASAVPWSRRKLLFYAGHIPKLYIRTLRYAIWSQIRSHPLTTSVSHTLGCTVRPYEICRDARRLAAPEGWRDFCRNSTEGACAGGACAVKSAAQLRHQCKYYKRVEWDSVLPDLRRDARSLDYTTYLATAHSHRFCLAAPGDFQATPKISEFIAVGAAGGCIPVLVVNDRVRQILPHSSWLDYCEFAYLVRINGAQKSMKQVLERLEAVTPAEAAAKHRALGRVRDAFVWRTQAQGGGPSAAHYLLLAACARAREARARNFTPTAAELRDEARPGRISRYDPLGAAGGPGGHVKGVSVDGDAAGVLTAGSGSCLLA